MLLLSYIVILEWDIEGVNNISCVNVWEAFVIENEIEWYINDKAFGLRNEMFWSFNWICKVKGKFLYPRFWSEYISLFSGWVMQNESIFFLVKSCWDNNSFIVCLNVWLYVIVVVLLLFCNKILTRVLLYSIKVDFIVDEDEIVDDKNLDDALDEIRKDVGILD